MSPKRDKDGAEDSYSPSKDSVDSVEGMFDDLLVPDLKAELKLRDQKVGGRKNNLHQRLEDHERRRRQRKHKRDEESDNEVQKTSSPKVPKSTVKKPTKKPAAKKPAEKKPSPKEVIEIPETPSPTVPKPIVKKPATKKPAEKEPSPKEIKETPSPGLSLSSNDERPGRKPDKPGRKPGKVAPKKGGGRKVSSKSFKPSPQNPSPPSPPPTKRSDGDDLIAKPPGKKQQPAATKKISPKKENSSDSDLPSLDEVVHRSPKKSTEPPAKKPTKSGLTDPTPKRGPGVKKPVRKLGASKKIVGDAGTRGDDPGSSEEKPRRKPPTKTVKKSGGLIKPKNIRVGPKRSPRKQPAPPQKPKIGTTEAPIPLPKIPKGLSTGTKNPPPAAPASPATPPATPATPASSASRASRASPASPTPINLLPEGKKEEEIRFDLELQFEDPTTEIVASMERVKKKIPDGVNPRNKSVNTEVGRSAIRGHILRAGDVVHLIDEQKDENEIIIVRECEGALNQEILEEYLELICDFHNKRAYSRVAGDTPKTKASDSPRTSERIKNQRKDCDPYIFQTHEFAEILINRDNRPGLEWGNVAASVRWKEIYPWMGNRGLREHFFHFEHIFIPIRWDGTTPDHVMLMVISPRNRTVELFNSIEEDGGDRNYYYYKIFDYLQYELGNEFVMNEWSFKDDVSCPQQEPDSQHSSVHCATNAYCVAFGTSVTEDSWTDENMVSKRKRMLHKLCRCSLDFKRQADIDRNVEIGMPPDDGDAYHAKRAATKHGKKLPKRNREDAEARKIFARQFREGYRHIWISGNNLLCGLRAVSTAVRAQDLGTYPTIEELQEIIRTDENIKDFGRQLEGEERDNDNAFYIDQLGAVLQIWGKERGGELDLRLGWMLNDSRVYLNIQKQNKDTTIVIWISSSSDDGADDGTWHYEAIAPKKVLSDPHNRDTYLGLRRNADGKWTRGGVKRKMKPLRLEQFQRWARDILQQHEYDDIKTQVEFLEIAKERNEKKNRSMELTPFKEYTTSKKKIDGMRRLVYKDMADEQRERKKPRAGIAETVTITSSKEKSSGKEPVVKEKPVSTSKSSSKSSPKQPPGKRKSPEDSDSPPTKKFNAPSPVRSPVRRKTLEKQKKGLKDKMLGYFR